MFVYINYNEVQATSLWLSARHEQEHACPSVLERTDSTVWFVTAESPSIQLLPKKSPPSLSQSKPEAKVKVQVTRYAAGRDDNAVKLLICRLLQLSPVLPLSPRLRDSMLCSNNSWPKCVFAWCMRSQLQFHASKMMHDKYSKHCKLCYHNI